MEPGFTSIDDNAALSVNSSNKLILFRFPKNFDIESLNGKTIDISDNKRAYSKKIKLSNDKYCDIYKDTTQIYSKIRPIIQNPIVGNAIVGPSFHTVYHVLDNTKDIYDPTAPTNTDMNNLPIRKAYESIEQVEFLRVRSLPIGSTSTIDSHTGMIIPCISKLTKHHKSSKKKKHLKVDKTEINTPTGGKFHSIDTNINEKCIHINNEDSNVIAPIFDTNDIVNTEVHKKKKDKKHKKSLSS